MYSFSFDPPLNQDAIYFTMKHVSFGPHLIQQIMVSKRQWSVPSSSIVVNTHDLYILYNVYCVVQETCTYCTVYTVLYMKSVHTVQCALCCTCVVHDICAYYLHCLRCYITFRLCICIHTQVYVLYYYKCMQFVWT